MKSLYARTGFFHKVRPDAGKKLILFATWGIFYGACRQDRSEATVRFGANSYNTEEKEEISSEKFLRSGIKIKMGTVSKKNTVCTTTKLVTPKEGAHKQYVINPSITYSSTINISARK